MRKPNLLDEVLDLWRFDRRITYRSPKDLINRSGQRNPARMIEDLMGADPAPGWDIWGNSEVQRVASQQSWDIWWDPQYRTRG
jgi:hypothetical protein